MERYLRYLVLQYNSFLTVSLIILIISNKGYSYTIYNYSAVSQMMKDEKPLLGYEHFDKKIFIA